MSILRRASRIPPRFLRSLVAPGRALLLARARLTLRRLPADLRLPRPRALILEPTLRCDQGCHFCFQQRPSDPRELDLDQVRRLLAVVGPRRIKLIGGEVLLRQDAGDLLEICSRACDELILTSNGSRLDRRLADQLCNTPNLARLSLSLCPGPDGPGGHLARLARQTRYMKGRVPMVAQLLVQPGEVLAERAAAAVAALPGAGIFMVLLMQEMWSSQGELDNTRRVLERELGWTGAWLLHGHSREGPSGSLDQLRSAMDQVNVAARRAGVLALQEVGYAPDASARVHLARPVRAQCRYLLEPTLRVSPEGEAIFCEHLRHPLGQVMESPLEQVWNGEPMRAIRRLLMARGPLPVCRRCCKLVHL